MTVSAVPAILATALAIGGAGDSLAAGDPLIFEDLGEPVRVRELTMECVTHGPDGTDVAWAPFESPDKNALVGVHLDSGEVTWVDLTRWGQNHIQMIVASGANLYAYSGIPGHFFKYDVASARLIDLGVPVSPASYWLGNAVGPDGRFHVGTYPGACLVRNAEVTSCIPEE